MEIYSVKENGKVVYIGQTTGTLEDRIRGHQETAKYAEQKYPLALAIHQKGIECFEFESIYQTDDLDKLNEMEMYYIKHFNTIEDGYNYRRGGDNRFHSLETRRKIREAQLGKKNHMYGRRGKDNPASKRVINLVTGDTYFSVTECAEAEGEAISKIAQVCRGDRQTLKGMVYRYIDNDGYIESIPNEKPLVRGVVYNKTKEKTYPTLAEASIDMGFHKGYLSKQIARKSPGELGFYSISENMIKVLK